MTQHTDRLFAALDADLSMERIGGGNETEVYRTDDGRFVVKIKEELGGEVTTAIAQAQELRAAAQIFAQCLGPYSLPSYYAIATDAQQRAQVLVIQPFAGPAQALYNLDYETLSSRQRAVLAEQLRDIIRRSLHLYKTNGSMPDLYGRESPNRAARSQMRSIWMMPNRIWSFLVQRNLLRSHNLMVLLHPDTEPRIVLVDYDPVRRSALYRRIYYLVRWFLFFRDHALIVLMKRGSRVPRAE
jgi:hypothetical protein